MTKQSDRQEVAARQWKIRLRVIWALVSIFVVECLVFGLAMLPGALFWEIFSLQTYPYMLVRIIVLSMAFVPAYGLFAVSLMVLSALSTSRSDRSLGHRVEGRCRRNQEPTLSPIVPPVRS